MARPLNDLIKKDVIFEWKEAQQHTFDTLKKKFMTAPVLVYPDNDCQFCLEWNASNYAIGAVLSILKEDKWHPVTYHSHFMLPAEHNYPIANKEMLSIIRALEIWRHYLEGAKHEFEVWNNHQNLQWFIVTIAQFFSSLLYSYASFFVLLLVECSIPVINISFTSSYPTALL